MSSDLLEYNLPNNAYAAFDAQSLLDLINQRLSDGGVFTDQNYTGSNISQITQIIAYSYHVLLYYLNRTSNETKFTEAEIYENINRIVKLLNYNPKGFQTSLLSFSASSTLNSGTYTIPRYSFFNSDGIIYSFIEDATFVKEKNGTEVLDSLASEYTLYQGKYRRNPNYFAIGEDFEVVELNSQNKNIDDVGIDVYVFKDGVWEEWTRVDSLYGYGYNDLVYEIRYNEKGNYEIKFGNNIYGKKLESNNVVSIYYLESDGESGEVSSNYLNGVSLTVFSEPNLNEILSDVSENVEYLSISNAQLLTFNNSYPSTKVNDGESVEQIRENAPLKFKAQDRLITAQDYESFVKNQFTGLVTDVKALSNRNFIDSHIKYLSEIGVTEPYTESRILENNLRFSDSCFFNNVYLYVVPRFEQKFSTTQKFYFIPPTQKSLIKTEIDKYKSTASEVVFLDPVYMGVDVAIGKSIGETLLSNIDETKIYIVRNDLSKNKEYIKDKFITILKDYFSPSNFKLGQEISLTTIKESILNTVGIKNFYIENSTNRYYGLNFYVWNPVYESDLTSTTQNLQLEDFQYAFLWDADALKNRIIVVDE